ncbi:general odorant-binding protein 28a-like isoform X1 [Trichoplusia ni]|uniref:General odorant-binding protein 28a-like isoform X1 n=1 Tax=Trichoplusia ni TaxID=7111 RepID=A0A7E5VQN1_TRINI|nr:general odorant-binding protein 28a-like isoform X1 [Trichoplusia ni]
MAQIHAHFEAVGKICVKDNPIGAKDIESLRARQKPSGENAPCFLACLMKNIGFMDANGMLQKESALELAKNIFPDPDELKMVEDYLHSCSHNLSAFWKCVVDVRSVRRRPASSMAKFLLHELKVCA